MGISLILIATGLLPLFPVDWWWIRIGDYPRVQLLIAYLVWMAVLVAYWNKIPAKVCLLLLLCCASIQLFWIFPYLPIAPREVEDAQSDQADVRMQIITANVLQDNRESAKLLELINIQDPDIVVLCEVNEWWMSELAELDEKYPFSLKHPLENTYGIAMYTRLEVLDAKIRGIVKDDIPSIDARIKLPSGQIFRLFAIHPNPPRVGEDTTKRDAELVLVGREVRDEKCAIVLGDMNDVGWSRTTNLFQEVSGLLDPRKGRGMYSTFDATSWIWRYPLDYIFHSENFRVGQLKILPEIGSDHFPLLVELSYEPEAAATQEGPELDAGDQEDAQDAVESVKTSED